MRAIPALLAASLLAWLPTSIPAQTGNVEIVDVNLTTHLGDQQSFVAGDRISFLLSLDRDAYVYLFYLDADSNLLQLLPNQKLTRHFFSAGLFIPVPDRQQPFRFTVQPPYGEEIMVAFASDNGSLRFSGEPLANGLILLRDSLGQIGERIRAASESYFGTGELILTTLPAQ